MKKNIAKVREQMLAAGVSEAKVEAYIESLDTLMPVDQTLVIRPAVTTRQTVTVRPAVDMVVMNDGSVCRRSDAIASDSDPWDTRR